MARKVVVAMFDAVGGPAKAQRAEDGLTAGPTDAGRYVVASCGRHVSPTYPVWSSIRWGTPLKEIEGKIYVQSNNSRTGGRDGVRATGWRPLEEFTTATREQILDYHEMLYGTRRVPDTWIFNDFGHATCYFFKDLNDNRVRDGKEKIHAEYIHTTPPDEAAMSLGLTVELSESHGCVHVKPADIDTMIAKGYIKKGNLVFVHKYAASVPQRPAGTGHAPYELHFYPGPKKIVVLGAP